MNDPYGPDPEDDPLAGMGAIFGDLSRLMGSTDQWESAAQMAAAIANEGSSEPNVDPAQRLEVEQLARVAELQVQEFTGRSFERPLRVEAVNRGQWARRFIEDQRPLMEGLAGSLGNGLAAQMKGIGELDDDVELAVPGLGSLPPQMLSQIMAMMGPMLLSMMSASTAGHLAAGALGHYELPLPRPADRPLAMVLSNVDRFASEWSLPASDIRLWVCLSDAAHHQVLTRPHVRDAVANLVTDYTRSFSDDPEQIERQAHDLGMHDLLGDGEPDLAALQRLAGDPDMLLGAMRSDHQRELIPRLDALVAVIEGWVDHVVDSVGANLLAEPGRVGEALRRRRVEAGPQTRFVERLLGLEMSQSTFDRGNAFIAGIVERSDASVLDTLWSAPECLPTATELDAPGLWMARVGIEGRDVELPDDLDIPDAPDF